MLQSKSEPGDRMDYHYHARLTIHRREELAKTVIQGRQVGGAFPSPGPCWLARSQFASPSFAATPGSGTGHPRGMPAACALDGPADCAIHGPQPLHRESYLDPSEAEQNAHARAPGSHRAL